MAASLSTQLEIRRIVRVIVQATIRGASPTVTVCNGVEFTVSEANPTAAIVPIITAAALHLTANNRARARAYSSADRSTATASCCATNNGSGSAANECTGPRSTLRERFCRSGNQQKKSCNRRANQNTHHIPFQHIAKYQTCESADLYSITILAAPSSGGRSFQRCIAEDRKKAGLTMHADVHRGMQSESALNRTESAPSRRIVD